MLQLTCVAKPRLEYKIAYFYGVLQKMAYAKSCFYFSALLKAKYFCLYKLES